MIRSTATLTFIVLAACAIALTGCGGDGSLSKNEYVEKNNAIQEQAMSSVSKLGSSADPAAMEKDVKTAQKSLDDAVADLKALDPPADWENEHKDLVAAIEGMSATMDDLVAATKTKDVKALTTATTKLTELQTKASTAISAMNADN